jgi:type III secretory pathway component EscV
MSRTSSNFFERLGLLIPGFKGYKTKEDLRESDYQIRLYAKKIIEKLIDKIEKEKRNLSSDDFMDVDFHQKDLKIIAVKVANQKYGYKAFFHKNSTSENIELLESVITHDESLINTLQNANDNLSINADYIKSLNNELEIIIDKRNEILG